MEDCVFAGAGAVAECLSSVSMQSTIRFIINKKKPKKKWYYGNG